MYSGNVARFLGGVLRNCCLPPSHTIATPASKTASDGNDFAVSVDGHTLVVSDGHAGGTDSLYVLAVADGSVLRVVGGRGSHPLQFNNPRQVWVACDGFVFIADCGNRRVQVLAPDLTFHSVIGADDLCSPSGVCANADVVVVTEVLAHRVSVYHRRFPPTHTAVTRFGTEGSSDGDLRGPCAVCFTASATRIAIADSLNGRVTIFLLDGSWVSHVGVGVLTHPTGIACSSVDELVVTDTADGVVSVFSDIGDLLASFCAGVTHVALAMHGSSLFASNYESNAISVWS
jgi:DNA-binding beta-propeller fold protein YncE